MIKPYLYVDNHHFVISFTCNKVLDKQQNLEKDCIYAKITKITTDNVVYITIWKNDILIVDQKVRYIENQSYEIRCTHEKVTPYSVFRYEGPNEAKGENDELLYQCKQNMHPDDAKKLYEKLLKEGLISKPRWDDLIDGYDWKCLACNESWLSVPDVGFVRENKIEIVNDEWGIMRLQYHTSPTPFGTFFYKGKAYIPCDHKEYHQLTWYNEEEYKKVREWHLKNCSHRKQDYPTFNQLWKTHQQNRNSSGGYMWRRKTDHYELIDNISFCKNIGSEKYFEKIVTLGYHTTNPKNAIPCPVCKDTYELFNSGYSPLNIFQRMREIFWRRFAWRLSRKICEYRVHKQTKKMMKEKQNADK